ncbi:MAG: hypothetical protein FD123_988 [Bacteroidetes bacterium]|nr:MAG: hypothetical protein FD123_988 [Bacteroidota bacterium]
MKKYLLLLLFAPFFFACSNEPKSDPVVDSLNKVNSGLNSKVGEQDSTIEAYLKAFNDIQDNLDEIKQKEKMVNAAAASGDVSSQQDQIKADIQAIYDLMAQNKQKLASMSKKLKGANKEIEELKRMIQRLETQLNEKDVEITALKDQLEKLNVELSTIAMNYQNLEDQSDQKTEKLNSAWYAFGTSKELIKQGVLTKEGGFIGIGKAEKLKADFNKNYFTKVDISKDNEISLGGAKKPHLVTTHPAGSYKWEGPENKVEKLVITNAEDFWSASKYLVIVVD